DEVPVDWRASVAVRTAYDLQREIVERQPPHSCRRVESTGGGLKVSEQGAALRGDVRGLRWLQLMLDDRYSQGIDVHTAWCCSEPSSFDERGTAARKRIKYSQTL